MTVPARRGRKTRPVKRGPKPKGRAMSPAILNATGVFEGLRISEAHRGKYVLIVNGEVARSSTSIKVLLREAARRSVLPVIVSVPADEQAIAAY